MKKRKMNSNYDWVLVNDLSSGSDIDDAKYYASAVGFPNVYVGSPSRIVVSTGSGDYMPNYDYDAEVEFYGSRAEVEEYLLSHVDDPNFAWADLNNQNFFILEDLAVDQNGDEAEFIPVECIKSYSHTLYKGE